MITAGQPRVAKNFEIIFLNFRKILGAPWAVHLRPAWCPPEPASGFADGTWVGYDGHMHCTVDTVVRHGSQGPPVVYPTRRNYCIELYRPLGALYTKRHGMQRNAMYLNRNRSAGPNIINISCTIVRACPTTILKGHWALILSKLTILIRCSIKLQELPKSW